MVRSTTSERMEVFISLKPLLLQTGFNNFNCPHDKWIKLGLRIATVAALLAAVVASTCFCVFEEGMFVEYTQACAMVIIMAFSLACYLVFLQQWKNLTLMMESIQSKINERAYLTYC